MALPKIIQPTLIVLETTAKKNIRAMAEKAKRNNISFEPHFKTHQSKEVGQWFREEGVVAITVSSVSMAAYFALNGWNKITIAFPVNVLEISKIDDLSDKISLTLLVQDAETVKKLRVLKNKVSLYIEIDAGYHRSGVGCDRFEVIQEIIQSIKNSKHVFKGFYCHAGNSYEAVGKKQIKEIYKDLMVKMNILKNYFIKLNPRIAIGDTPICSVVNLFEGVDSIHPGNFVFYDFTQVLIGSCQLNNVATFLVCPIVAKNLERNQLVIYGGGIHLSKEAIKTKTGFIFGLVGFLNDARVFTSYKNSFVTSVSQEHGIISSTSKIVASIQVGDTIAVLPVHSCMTVDCITQIYTENGFFISKMRK